MEKKKDKRLLSIYIKVHEQLPLTMDDITYLSIHNPECYRKIYDRLVENPSGKSLLAQTHEKIAETANSQQPREPIGEERPHFEAVADCSLKEKRLIQHYLHDLYRMDDAGVLQGIDAQTVLELVGNLFMYDDSRDSIEEEFFTMYEENTMFTARA